jgi:hypothetical protein
MTEAIACGAFDFPNVYDYRSIIQSSEVPPQPNAAL